MITLKVKGPFSHKVFVIKKLCCVGINKTNKNSRRNFEIKYRQAKTLT